MMKIIDTHAHYDDEVFEPDREELLSSLPALGIERAVTMGASMKGAEDGLALAKRFSHIYAGIGIHPDEVGCLDEAAIQHLADMAADERCVVYGEIGLDYYWNVEEKDVQKKWFIRQIDLAKQLGLPINVHSREASQDTFDILMREHAGTTGGVIHCYSGSAEMAKEYIKRGYMLGIGGVVTFKNAKTIQSVVEQIPLEYLVTETDSPYLAPTPYRGKRNDSTKIPLMIAKIAEIKGMDEEEAAQVLYDNALRVYRWT